MLLGCRAHRAAKKDVDLRFYNFANDCYANALLQCIFDISDFQEFVFVFGLALRHYHFAHRAAVPSRGLLWRLFALGASEPSPALDRSQYPFLELFSSFFDSLSSSGVRPNPVLSFTPWTARVGLLRQQDADELFIFLMDGLKDDLDRFHALESEHDAALPPSNPPFTAPSTRPLAKSRLWFRRFFLSPLSLFCRFFDDSLLFSLRLPFEGASRGVIACHCGASRTSSRLESFYNLSLPVLGAGRHLPDLLREYFSDESVEHENARCPHCHVHVHVRAALGSPIWEMKTKAKKTFFVEQPPEILCVHFRVLVQNYEKVGMQMEYPLEVDLGPYMVEQAKGQRAKWMYELHAVIVHVGDGYGGHFFALKREKGGSGWIRCDDESVYNVSYETVRRHAPYILFFKRK